MDRAQALDDLNAERSGLSTGRISKFLTRAGEDAPRGDKRAQKGLDGLSALDVMLATNPDYAELHADLADDLRAAQQRNHALDERLDAAIEKAQRDLDSLVDQAALLPSGERAFLDGNGTAWTLDGTHVDPAITEGIDWTGRPQRSELLEVRETLQSLRDAQSENGDLGIRLGEIDNAIHDTDGPATMGELQNLHDEVEAIEEQMSLVMVHISPHPSPDVETEHQASTFNMSLPDL